MPRCRGIARPSPNCLFATGLSQAAGLSLTGCDAVKVKADAAIGFSNGKDKDPVAQSATLVLLAKTCTGAKHERTVLAKAYAGPAFDPDE